MVFPWFLHPGVLHTMSIMQAPDGMGLPRTGMRFPFVLMILFSTRLRLLVSLVSTVIML